VAKPGTDKVSCTKECCEHPLRNYDNTSEERARLF